jgi:putative MATE family efflux protein
MLTRDRTRTILKLALPICIALSSSLMMSLIDLAMVGTLGNNAVAAVGLSSFCSSLILAFVSGVAPAVQGLVARRRGEQSSEPTCLPLNAGILMVLAVGVPLTIGGYLLTPVIFSVISSDPAVREIAIPFLRILYIGLIGAGLNNAFKGYWTGMERPNLYMMIVLFMNALNILVNYVLIFGHFGAPALGAEGAAIGTTVALYAGVIVNIVMLAIKARKEGFLSARPDVTLGRRVFRLGVPATMQEFFYSAGYIVFFWMVGQVGTADLAAANVLVRVTMVLVLLAMALGMASATLVSKAMGAGDVVEASRWGWDTGKLGVIGISLLGLPLLIFPDAFLSVFLTDPATIHMAVVPLQLVAATTGIGSLIYIFSYTLYSVGDGARVILISFSTQWILFLPGVWVVGPYLNYGLLQIWIVQMVYGALATALITVLWIDGRWKRIQI